MRRNTDPAFESYINDIDGITIDEQGTIHTPYGSFHPVTGEGLPINAPKKLMHKILVALIRDGEESEIVDDFDIDRWFDEEFSKRRERDVLR